MSPNCISFTLYFLIFQIEEGGVELHGLYSFTITGPGSKSFIVAASSPQEKQKWMDDIQKAVSISIKKVEILCIIFLCPKAVL